MKNWYSRQVFFVKDIEDSLSFYLDKLGFTEAWRHEEEGETIVVQVNRDGLELILNKGDPTPRRGRIFINLWDEHIEPLKTLIKNSGIKTMNKSWGMPVTEILDPDKNELLFSPQIL